jgi:LCP family protein required for cell wall assembly
LSRKALCIGLAIAIAACVGVPVAGFAIYNLAYFLRERQPAARLPPGIAATPTPGGKASPTLAPVCGGPPTMRILLIGSDSRADSYSAGLADAIRVVRVDFIQPGITHLAFPRDLYVEIPGIESHGGITHGKINQAYLYGNPAFGYSDVPGQGPGLLAATLKLNFGVNVDRYVAVNLLAFSRIVDDLGGLDISLPYTVDGRAARSADQDRYFPAGQLHLNGYRTMLLARMRPNGDLERLQTQDLILQAFAAELLSPGSLPKLPALAETLYGSVQTDLGAGEISSLLCLGAKIDPAHILAVDFPDEWFTGTRIQDPVLGNTFVWEADAARLQDYMRQFEAGELVPAEPPQSSTPSP